MKKQRKYILLGLAAAVFLLGAAVALVAWALNSAEGTRVLFKTLSFFSPVQIDAGEIQGRLRDELRLKGVRIRWAGGEVRADRLHLRWQPAELWNLKVLVDELSLEGVLFHDRGSETGGIRFFGWPAVPYWLSKTQGRIALPPDPGAGLSGPRSGSASLGTPVGPGAMGWGFLEIGDFRLSGPAAQAEGTMKVSFARPSLNLDLKTSFAKEYAGVDSLSARLLLGAGKTRRGFRHDSGPRAKAEYRKPAPRGGGWFDDLGPELAESPGGAPGKKGLGGRGAWTFGVRPSLQGRLGFWK